MLFGFIYVAVGGFLAELSEDKFEKSKKGRTLCLCVVFVIAFAVESVIPQILGFKQFGCDIKILLVPFTFFLMIFLLSLNFKDRKIYVYIRKMSLMMFLSQRIFISLADIFLMDTIIVQNSMIYFIFILGATLAFSDIFIRMSKKIKVLKYFY